MMNSIEWVLVGGLVVVCILLIIFVWFIPIDG
jgi:hypothetical protein